MPKDCSNDSNEMRNLVIEAICQQYRYDGRHYPFEKHLKGEKLKVRFNTKTVEKYGHGISITYMYLSIDGHEERFEAQEDNRLMGLMLKFVSDRILLNILHQQLSTKY